MRTSHLNCPWRISSLIPGDENREPPVGAAGLVPPPLPSPPEEPPEMENQFLPLIVFSGKITSKLVEYLQ